MSEQEFAEWICREMPAGTVIGDPKWWAPRIFRLIDQSAEIERLRAELEKADETMICAAIREKQMADELAAIKGQKVVPFAWFTEIEQYNYRQCFPSDRGAFPLFARSVAPADKDAEPICDALRWLIKQQDAQTPIASVVWKRDSDPNGEWVNLIDGADLMQHIVAAMAKEKQS